MKRMVSALLTLVLMLGCARAEFAPLLDAFEAACEDGRTMLCTVTAEVNELAAVSDSALQAVQNQVNKLSLRMALETGAQDASLVTLAYDGEDVLTFGSARTESGTQVLLGGDIYLTGNGEVDALSLLLGNESGIFPHLEQGREALWAAFGEMYQVLAVHGKEGELVKATTSIKNVGASGRYIPYTLDEDGMNAAWQELLQVLEPVLAALYPDSCDEQKDLLASLCFYGDTEIRRIRDKEENDWGFRVATHVSGTDGIRHKVTVLVGWRPERGFDIEVKAPAVEGNDTLKLLFSGAYTLSDRENLLKLEGSVTHRRQGESQTASLEGTLKYTAEEAGARLHGKLSGKVNDDAYKLTPDFVCTGDAVTGTVGISRSNQNGQSTCTLHVDAGWTDPVTLTGEKTLSMADMETWEKEFILRDVEKEWMQALVQVLQKIPSDERALITHVLRSDAWLGKEESVPVPENGEFRRVEEELVE